MGLGWDGIGWMVKKFSSTLRIEVDPRPELREVKTRSARKKISKNLVHYSSGGQRFITPLKKMNLREKISNPEEALLEKNAKNPRLHQCRSGRIVQEGTLRKESLMGCI